jgi:GTP-binding protein EngB required for normal cell division
MGGNISTFEILKKGSKEKDTWGKDKHTLYQAGQPENLRDEMAKLNYFDNKLYLCYMEKPYSKTTLKYQHWFVSDKKWHIEFGDGSLDSFHDCSVTVHCENKLKGSYYVSKEFDFSAQVKARMVEVLGIDNFSLVFRNSEHVARYIQCGSWISLQTGRKGKLSHPFIKKMKEEDKKMMNTKPMELIRENTIVTLYPDESNRPIFLQYLHEHLQRSQLEKEDDGLYNVVFLGPTGSGKSSLINLLFNATVNLADSGASSVTRDIRFAQGIAQFSKLIPKDNEKSSTIGKGTSMYVNIIDTVGFCDSKMSETEVVTYVKDKLKDNLMHIDRVVIVCSGRLEKAHQDSIMQFMKWLKYDSYKKNFAIVYNKCDGWDEGKRLESLSEVCSMLGVDTTVTNYNGRTSLRSPIPMVNALGFHPKAPFQEIEDDLRTLFDSVIIPTYSDTEKGKESLGNDKEVRRQRIPICKQSCTII